MARPSDWLGSGLRFPSSAAPPCNLDSGEIMTNRFCELHIQQFRSITDLWIKNLGQVNLITGMNNTGKTSLLEAIQILASEGSFNTISQILRLREEDSVDGNDSFRSNDADNLFLLSSLFPGYPEFSTELPPIRIEGCQGDRPATISIKPCWLSEHRSESGVRQITIPSPTLFDEDERLPGLRIQVNDVERLFPLDFFRRGGFRTTRRPELLDDRRPPCHYVGTGNSDRTAGPGVLWDRIALSDLESHVVSALAIIDESISAVSMVGGEGVRSGRIAIVRSKRFPRPVPLKSFGDGVNRLFGIVLALVNSKDGCLLIDEFENGLHHTVQAAAWKMIFQLAAALNVQVFATTHSQDAVEAFQQVAGTVPENGVLVRLARRGQSIVSTVFSEDELAVVTRNQIEVR
jgi:hypothetical protein